MSIEEVMDRMTASSNFSWLHLTDFHFGLTGQKFLWSNLRQPFFEDLRRLHDQTGPWDVVFFSGDFVQSGKTEEFIGMQAEVLEQLWQTLTLLGSGDAVLLPVPGNHDLVRPDPQIDDPGVDALLKDKNFASIEEKFWEGSSGAYRTPIFHAFENYTNWLSTNRFVPFKKMTLGKLPGDFSITLESSGKTIGVVGLNTTFLQLKGGDFRGHLAWHVSQLGSVCPQGIDHWTKQHDACFLLTHQGPDWLTPTAREHGFSEICPAGRFALHLYGHEHETDVSDLKRGKSTASLRLCQARSTFGMEKFGEPPQHLRSHGYVLGQLQFTNDACLMRLWPRRATNKPDGWRFIRDEESCILLNDGGTAPDEIWKAAPPLGNSTIISLKSSIDPHTAQAKLAKLRARPCVLEEQHRRVRRPEAQKFQALLKANRCAWLVADWQMGKEGFLADSIFELGGDNSLKRIYRLDCGAAEGVEEVFDTAETQLGLAFVEFAEAVKELPGVFLIFEDIPTALFSRGGWLNELTQKIDSILDFSPQLRIVFVSRVPPADLGPDRFIWLRALEITDTREYLSNHPLNKPSFLAHEALEKIHQWTGGVPSIIDRLLHRSQTLTLPQIIGEGDGSDLSEIREPVPQSLINAVENLESADGEHELRSYALLKLLTVLKDGETFESIRRLYPKKPFHQAHIRRLMQHSLIESVEISQTANELSPRLRGYLHVSTEAPRLLRIPRQVRDFVSVRIPPDERTEIFNSALEAFFGRRWHEGKIKLRPAIHNAYQRSSISGPGNELVVIQFLLDRSLAGGRRERINRHAKLAIDYCERLLEEDRFRDLELAARVIADLLDGGQHEVYWIEAAYRLAEALRMTGQRDEAVRLFEECLQRGQDFLIKSFSASIHLSLALAYKTMKNNEQALAHANTTIELEHKDSGDAIQAKALVAELTLAGEAKQNALTHFYHEARHRSQTTAANNIALDLAKTSNSEPEKLKLLDDVIRSSKDPYSRARGIADKAALLQRTGKLNKLTPEEEDLLCAAYSYSYTQRMNVLIEECHQALWGMYRVRNLIAPLFRLFRYTSFFWRLCGKDSEDKSLAQELVVTKESLGQAELAVIPIEIQYFEYRCSALRIHRVIDV